LNVFAAASLTLAISLTKIYGFSNGHALAIVASAAASFLVGLFSSCLYYRMCLSPLRKFPGPSLASVSSLWWPTQLSMKGSYKWLEHQHKKHGKFVRVGANDLSITDPDIMELAFGVKSRVGKGPWYDGDAPLCSMHTTRDKGLHDRRRRVWAPAFSEKALREYETEVQRLIAKLVQKIGEHKGSAANVTKWFALFSFEAMGQLAFGKDYEMLDSGEKRHELDMLE
jgi:tryprostatin B 6-hydroxylase